MDRASRASGRTKSASAKPARARTTPPPTWILPVGLATAAVGILALIASAVLVGTSTPEVPPTPGAVETAERKEVADLRLELRLAKIDLQHARREVEEVLALSRRSGRTPTPPGLRLDARLEHLRDRIRSLRSRLYEARARATAELAPPSWYTALPRNRRPPLPLPQGLEFGQVERSYVLSEAGVELRYVQPGAFTRPNGVSIEIERGFFLSTHEISQREFLRFCDETGHPIPAEEARPLEAGEIYPVANVSHKDAVAYARWAMARLPSESEWEYAAGGDRGSAWPWGDTPQFSLANLATENDRYARAAPRGAHERGSSRTGIHALAGNLSEWVADEVDRDEAIHSSGQHPLLSSQETGTPRRRLVGGNFRSVPRAHVSDYRDSRPATYRSPTVGIRLAVSAAR